MRTLAARGATHAAQDPPRIRAGDVAPPPRNQRLRVVGAPCRPDSCRLPARREWRHGLLATLLFAVLAPGCLDLSKPGPLNGAFKDDFTFLPDADRTRAAFVQAVQDPWTWQPLAGSFLLDATRVDNDLSERARDDNPVFGSRDSARAARRNMLDALRIASVLSTASLEGKSEFLSWSGEKNEDLGGQVIATGFTYLTATGVGELMGRDAPEGSGKNVMPARDTAEAFTHSSWINRSMRDADLPRGFALPFGAGATALAFGTAWASVEAGEHRLTDVLVGMALGNFATVFIGEAFLGHWRSREVQFAVRPEGDSFRLAMSWGF